MTVKACWSVPEDVVDHWLVQVQILEALHITDELCSPCTPNGGQHNAIGGRLVSKSLVSHPLPQFNIPVSNIQICWGHKHGICLNACASTTQSVWELPTC